MYSEKAHPPLDDKCFFYIPSTRQINWEFYKPFLFFWWWTTQIQQVKVTSTLRPRCVGLRKIHFIFLPNILRWKSLSKFGKVLTLSSLKVVPRVKCWKSFILSFIRLLTRTLTWLNVFLTKIPILVVILLHFLIFYFFYPMQ